MIRTIFQRRSARVIAVLRMVLAAVFLLAMWFDPQQPVRSGKTGYALLGGYLAFAAVLLAVSWRSWWFDHRLAWPVFVVDNLVFLVAVYFTEGTIDDFTSPFLAFFVFLLVAATIRWGWRATALTGVLLCAAYVPIGLAMDALLLDFDIYRFGRRITYMLVLTLVLSWFALQRRELLAPPLSPATLRDPEVAGQAFEAALRYARNAAEARIAVISWTPAEEPVALVRTWDGSRLTATTLGPDVAEAGPGARLFDLVKGRALVAGREFRPRAIRGPLREPLAKANGVAIGLAAPLAGASGQGELVLGGLPGLSVDDIELAASLGREIAALLDREAMLTLSRVSAATQTRNALARDLHDSVAQSLAGASFRLEGLRNWIREGRDPEPEFLALKQALKSEQRYVREIIERLREAPSEPRTGDLPAQLRGLTQELGKQWNARVELNDARGEAEAPLAVIFEIRQIVREAVANAVRHGKATSIGLELDMGASEIGLRITDNGRGFQGEPRRPWTIAQRVRQLAGSLLVESADGGTRLDIALPRGTAG